MRYRPLGRTGLTVSEVGFGAWGIGGRTAGETSYGATDDRVSLAALDMALDLGITFFDTSNVYGDGHAESLIGRALKGRRTTAVVATKAGWTRLGGKADYSADALRRSLEGSLRRLDSDYLDLLQLHNPPPEALAPEGATLATLRRLREEGLIRAFGASLRSPAEALAAISRAALPMVQVNLNMLDLRAVTGGLLQAAACHGAGIIARTPLCFGFLAGEVSADTPFPEGDHRRGWPRAQLERWTEGGRRIFERVEVPEGQTRTQVALRYCLSHPEVATVIPGILTLEQAIENAAASDLGPLPAKDLAAVEEINRRLESFVR